MKKFLDTDHPWIRPLWARVLCTTIPAAWSVLEFTTGSPFWGVIFLGLAAYAAWGFFIDFHPERAAEGDKPAPDDPPQQ